MKNSFCLCFLIRPTGEGRHERRRERTENLPEPADLKPVLTPDEVNELLARVYPELNAQLGSYDAVDIFAGGCTVRLNADERHLRPGGTVSGPSLFTLADIGGYVCVLSHAGPDVLSVTTNLNINFLRKPAQADLIADARLMKVGKRLAVGEVVLTSAGSDDPVAHVTATYSIPNNR